MSKRPLIAFLVFLLLLPGMLRAQSGIRDSVIGFTFMGLNYGYFIPGGDMADRFGNCSIAGIDLLRKTKKNILWGFSGGFIFGNNVHEPGFLNDITTSSGYVIGADGFIADVRVYERGYHVSAAIGKIIPVKKINPNSGFMIMAGPGFIQHKIRIETLGNSTPQIANDYLKGYDRLSNGIEIKEFIGFVSFGNRQLVNFYAGIELVQAFTENRRDYTFDNPSLKGQKRTDLLWGFKAGWILPFYKKKPKDFYFY